MDADAVIAALAARQHGVVTRAQLGEAGVAPHLVDWRMSRGRLRRVHRGVFLVGPVEVPRAREMAAALACGPAAVVSHRSGASLWGLIDGRARPAQAEVIDPVGDCRRPGITVHHIRTLRREEVTRLEGIRVTTPERTLYDLAGVASARELERWVAEALARGLTRERRIQRLLERHPRGPGSRLLRDLLDEGAPARTRSEAEERFLALVRTAGLPRPEVNVRVAGLEVDVHAAGLEVDFLWRAARLVVEVDGRAYHGRGRAFERDRLRDATLAAVGLRVVRVTWGQLTREPLAVVARVAGALAAGRTG